MSVVEQGAEMERYVIHGGTPLSGDVTIAGAKNASLPIIAASLMADEPVDIENLPDVSDTGVMIDALEMLGANVSRLDRHSVRVDATHIDSVTVDNDSVRKIRGSYYFLGALLGKYHEAYVALPGGCDIGCRAIDQHIKGMRALGAEVNIEHGLIRARATQLHGAHIYMDVVSVGATMNIMLAAALAEGRTVIENAAKEPHIVDLASFLGSCGADIRGAGTDVIRIRGVERLHGTDYAIIPDQIEAGTFMAAALITGGDVMVHGIIPKHMESIAAKLLEIGCYIEEYDDAMRVTAATPRRSTQVKTLPYPGFPTDMQPQITTALSVCEGTSIVNESIYENRFKYIDQLICMGADIKVEGNIAIVTGVPKLTGAEVEATDLRAGAALVLAALAADGMSVVEDVRFIERGYEDFHRKLAGLGGDITRSTGATSARPEIPRVSKLRLMAS